MTQPLRSDPQGHIPALDGLRAIAVLLVLLRHSAWFYLHLTGDEAGYRAIFNNPLGHLLMNGRVGVDLFFLLSGYLISRPFFINPAINWKYYLARRGLRILPAYLVMLALVLLGLFPGYVVASGDMLWRIFYHLLFLQDYLPSNILVVLWSLGVEEKFYLLCPLLLPFILKLPATRLQYAALLGIVFMAPLARGLTLLYYGQPDGYYNLFQAYRSPFHACVDGLFLGVLVARYQTDTSIRHVSVDTARVIMYAGFLALLLIVSSHEMPDSSSIPALVLRPTGVDLIMAFIMFGTVMSGGAGWLAARPMRYIGKTSYSLYLLHVPLIPACYALACNFTGVTVAPYFPVYLALLAATTLICASLMYYLIEKPCLGFKERFR